MNIGQFLIRARDAIDEILSYLNPHYLNARSTAKTSLGFMGTFMERWLPEHIRRTEMEAIFNFLPLSDSLLTSGQPTEAQLAAVKAAGVTHVINLAPHGLENSLKNEPEIVDALGMRYIHIPVDFKNPTEANFSRFCEAMQQVKHDKVLVHCAANMRVSAFMFRYRIQVLGEDRALAQQDLQKIWEPFEVWAGFVERGVLEQSEASV